MGKKITISLDDEILVFVDKEASTRGLPVNRSGYINAVLAAERSRRLELELIAAYTRDAQDPNWRQEAAEWDSLAGDGIA